MSSLESGSVEEMAALLRDMATWLRNYADADDWHAYIGSDGGRIDPDVDALLARFDDLNGGAA